MDLYLPEDFYRLRDDLNDWRDLGSAYADADPAPGDEAVRARAATQDCADPSWLVI